MEEKYDPFPNKGMPVSMQTSGPIRSIEKARDIVNNPQKTRKKKDRIFDPNIDVLKNKEALQKGILKSL